MTHTHPHTQPRNPFFFVGGRPALDFVNTVPVLADGPVELLSTWPDVARWAAASGAIADWGTTGVRSLDLAPAQAARWLVRAIRLREAVRTLLQCRLDGLTPSRDALHTLNAELRGGLRRTIVRTTPDRSLTARVEGLGPSPRRLLAELAESAAQVLTHADADRVRRCAGHACVLWFLDTSKNGQRRWCSMEACGNRAKAAAHYRRNAGG